MDGPFETHKKNLLFAELFGIMLGDGNIYVNKKHHVYQVRIAFEAAKELEYREYVSSLLRTLFNIEPRHFFNNHGGAYTCISKRHLTEYFMSQGLLPRTRDRQITTPFWIVNDTVFLQAFIRGLTDTDGSIFRLSNKDPHILRIGYKSANRTLMEAYREGLLKLGYHPSKIMRRNIFLTRKEDTRRFIQEIGFSNPKHRKRLEQFSIAP
jgi:intein/homing endonuclease